MRLNPFYTLIAIAAFALSACGGGSNSDDGPDPTPEVPAPGAATLVFPDNNTECNEGVVLSETQSTVTFEWTASENTDTYEINLRNLNTNNIARTNSPINEAAITILRGTPYEWFVVSSANGTNVTSSSPTYRFFNQGPGIENYAPFPAEAVSPSRGATINNAGTVTLEWTASDVDNDIVSYDILFGTESTPTTSIGTVSETTLDASAMAGQVYFWRVITIDSENNSSQSEIFEFNVR